MAEPRAWIFLFKCMFHGPRLHETDYFASGFSGGMSAFINGHFLGSAEGTSHSQEGIDVLNVTYTFLPTQLKDLKNGSFFWIPNY